jgi:hypothetical protein
MKLRELELLKNKLALKRRMNRQNVRELRKKRS